MCKRDGDGVYPTTPNENDSGELSEEMGPIKLLEQKLPDMPIERELLRTLENARSLSAVQVINGLIPGNLGRALRGERVGTMIYSSRHGDRQ